MSGESDCFARCTTTSAKSWTIISLKYQKYCVVTDSFRPSTRVRLYQVHQSLQLIEQSNSPHLSVDWSWSISPKTKDGRDDEIYNNSAGAANLTAGMRYSNCFRRYLPRRRCRDSQWPKVLVSRVANARACEGRYISREEAR